jgi:hypothetical protein
VALLGTNHFVPVPDSVSSTNTITGTTRLVEQPEVILQVEPHWEPKAGLTLGLNPPTPPLGLRGQVDWLWGKLK